MRNLIDLVENAQSVRTVDAILYHGTNNSFDKFENGHSNGWSNPRSGFYFTDDEQIAEEFFGRITAWHVHLNNVADFENGMGSDIIQKAVQILPALENDLEIIRNRYGINGEEQLLATRFTRDGYLQTENFITALKTLGYDGMIFDDLMSRTPFTSYVAFDADNIKRV